MKFPTGLILVLLICSCGQADIKKEPPSINSLAKMLRKDPLFREYAYAYNNFLTELRSAHENLDPQFTVTVKKDIIAGKIRSLPEFKDRYVAAGGSSAFINALQNLLVLKAKLRKKHLALFRSDPELFKEAVAYNLKLPVSDLK